MNDDSFKFPGNDGVPGVPELSVDDQAALDALVEAGFEVNHVPAGLQDRARRVTSILGLINTAPLHSSLNSDDALIELTLARVQRERSAPTVRLSASDEDALEALIGADYDPACVAGPLRKRASRQSDLLAMLEPSRAELAGAESRIARTLHAVQTSIDSQERKLRFDPVEASPRRFRLADLVTVAALLLIASAAIGPMVGAMREQARQASCRAGLLNAGIGLASYAADSKDAMPMASASIAGNPWWNVGTPERSNSANLYRTINTGYTKVSDLACPGNAQACRAERPAAQDWQTLGEVSYSYQNMFAKERPRWNEGRLLVVVDGSPVVRRAVQKQLFNPFANSMNHNGRGQNALFTDGSVEWLSSPVLASGDNIWLPGVIERAIGHKPRPTQLEPINGDESPESRRDIFVGP